MQWGFFVQLLNRTKDLELIFEGQTVARLCFDRRRSTAEKPLSVSLSGFHQISQRCIARRSHGRSNAAAPRGNLAISRAAGPLFELMSANPGKDRRTMRIDKTRHDDASFGIDHPAIFLDK